MPPRSNFKYSKKAIASFRKPARKFMAKKKYNKKPSTVLAKNAMVTINIPNRRSLQMFPDVYRCHGHVQFENSVQLGTASVDSYFQLEIETNSLNCVTKNMFNRGGAYGSTIQNTASGTNYLLGDINRGGNNSGANAPYFKYRIVSQKVTVTWMPQALQATAIDQRLLNTASEVVVTFQNQALNQTFLLNQTNYAEQPYSKSKLYPAISNSIPVKVSNFVTTLEMYGDRYKSSLETGQFDATFNTGPAQAVFCIVTFATIGTTATNYYLNGAYIVDIDQEIEFFDRNSYVPNIPA